MESRRSFALLGALLWIGAGSSSAWAQAMDAVKAAYSQLGGCYIGKTRSLIDEPHCYTAEKIADTALSSCRSEETALLKARKKAELDAGNDIITDLRDSLRKSLVTTVVTNRLQAGRCNGKP